jgi:IS1 family transposase
MANNLSREKQIAAISALVEGTSIRATERMLGIHRDTIMRLGVRIGEGCSQLLDGLMRDLPCERVQVDELWGFIGKKQRRASPTGQRFEGDWWTFVAIDADTKIVPCYRVGRRDADTANAFVIDLAGRMRNRIQLSSDSLAAYVDAVTKGFHGQVDYAQIVKSFSSTAPLPSSSRYSPPPMVAITKQVIAGSPDLKHVSTSFIERQNLTCRMHCRRLTRLTNGFSKRIENFRAAIGLHFGYYNLFKMHRSLRCTPAMRAGIVGHPWSVADLLEAATKS